MSRNGTDPNTGQNYSYFDRNGGYFRPDIVGDPNSASDASQNRLTYLSSGAYAVPALNTAGNAPRNSAWGPGTGRRT